MNDPMTPRTVMEERVLPYLHEHPEVARQVKAVLELVFPGEGGGDWIIDCRGAEPRVLEEPTPPDCKVVVPAHEFQRLMEAGTLDAWAAAFVAGRVKVQGDILLPFRLRPVLLSSLSESVD